MILNVVKRKKIIFCIFSQVFLLFFILTSFEILKAEDFSDITNSDDNSKIFWFTLISDTHIGTPDANDTNRLNSFFKSVKSVINPKFIINAGDLTDHVRCNLLTGGRTCDHLAQWKEYANLIDANKIQLDFYSDAPGNHDQYWENIPLLYYRDYSVQGKATGENQRSWLFDAGYGTYKFITIATPHPGYTNAFDDRAAGCPSELSDDELNFIENALMYENNVNLTFIFGHHPVQNLVIGRTRFLELLNHFGVAMYGYGHTHRYSDSSRISSNTLNLNVGSLWERGQYAIIAIDNNGISVSQAIINQWPAIIITKPLDRTLGGVNPQAYPISPSQNNKIRVLVFGSMPTSQVLYRVDGLGSWLPLNKVRSLSNNNSHLWETTSWNTTTLSPGIHTLQVKAVGLRTRYDTVTFEIK